LDEIQTKVSRVFLHSLQGAQKMFRKKVKGNKLLFPYSISTNFESVLNIDILILNLMNFFFHIRTECMCSKKEHIKNLKLFF
jgi:hypothetical protein